MLKKLSAIALSFIMFVSMSEFAFVEVFADDAAGQNQTEQASGETSGQGVADGQSDNQTSGEVVSGEAGDVTDAGNGDGTKAGSGNESGTERGEAGNGDQTGESGTGDVTEAGSGDGTGTDVTGNEEPGTTDPENPDDPEEPQMIERKFLENQHIANPIMQTLYGAELELRTAIGEPSDGHAVLQGAATDGEYAYCMMTCSATQKGRVVKLRIGTNEIVNVSGEINIHHGNGMTYDSKRNCLVVVGAAGRRQQLTFIDADTLGFMYYRNVGYANYKGGAAHPFNQGHEKSGLKNIAYNAEYDCYIAAERNEYSNVSGDNYNIMFFNAEPDENGTLQAIGFAWSNIYKSYTKVYQAIDSDDQYVYYLLSKSGSQKNNMFVATEYHPEKLDPIKNGEAEFIAEPWYCGAKEDGGIDAVVTVNTGYEVEGLYHATDPETGENHFYMTEYNKDIRTKTVSKKVKYKVKWKKVKKKVKWKKVWKKVKWKKVKTKSGKKKWKYKKKKVWKYKTKKVWKYKTKTKTVKEKVQYYHRQDHIFDLGVIARTVVEEPAPENPETPVTPTDPGSGDTSDDEELEDNEAA